MFAKGNMSPFPQDTVIRWEHDTGRDCGRIQNVWTSYYTVRNAKGEFKTVTFNDSTLRVVRAWEEVDGPLTEDLTIEGALKYLYALANAGGL